MKHYKSHGWVFVGGGGGAKRKKYEENNTKRRVGLQSSLCD